MVTTPSPLTTTVRLTNLDQNHPPEPEQHTQDGVTNNLGPPKEKHVQYNYRYAR